MSRFSVLRQIQQLDPLHDYERIVFLCTCFEFPFDTTRALEFALFRTYCVPSISELLDRTGEFQHRAQKRYDDTDLIVSELMEHGCASERGKRALRRMNQLHGRFQISNNDFLYVLSTFIFEPIRWNAQFGWRHMCDQEKLGLFHFWREVGRRMNIRAIPEEYSALEEFNLRYEREHFHFAESNRRVGGATREMFVRWFPRLLHPLARQSIYALLDPPLITAFGFPQPARWLRGLVRGTLKLRGKIVRWLPARRNPRLRTSLLHRSYPEGYRIENLGPPTPPPN
jgi:hypothetical protein